MTYPHLLQRLLKTLLSVGLGFLLSAQIVFAAESVEFDYAQNLQIEEFPTHRLITVKNVSRNSKEQFHYALVPKGQAVPELPKRTLVIRTPVERVVVMATTFIGYIDALDQHDRIVGVATPDFVNNQIIREGVASGKIKSVQTGQSMDLESILLLRPDLILTSSSGNPRFDVHPQLARSGLPVVLSASYMEQHPLARAEWIKFVAAFFGTDAQAEATFKGVSKLYNTQAATTAAITKQPTVFCGTPYAGAWHVPGGQSYVAQTLKDAGADYLWADDQSSGGLPLDFERVFLKAAQADYWLNPSSYRDLNSLFSSDQRFKKFHAAKTQHIYNNSKQYNATGGNNIYERGTVRPDEVLADLIKIFHPDLATEHEFIYYEQLR